jgi:hypothetical protein
MGEFFANLGTASTSRKSTRQRPMKQQDPSKVAHLAGSSSAKREEIDTKKVNMSSFFDEVNRIVANNKNESEKAAAVKDATKNESAVSASSSILDLLPPNRVRGPNAFDEDDLDQYNEMLDSILDDSDFRRTRKENRLDEKDLHSVEEWLRSEEPAIKYTLPTLESVLDRENPVEPDEDNMRKALREELSNQRSTFQEHHGWNETQYALAMRGLLRMGNFCAKKAAGPPAEIAWEKLKEAGFKMNQDMLQNYLYVTSTFSSRSSSLLPLKGGSVLGFLDEGTYEEPEHPEEEGSDEKDIDVANEVALCHDILFGASEQTTLTRVRRLVSQGKPASAERLLERNAVSEWVD